MRKDVCSMVFFFFIFICKNKKNHKTYKYVLKIERGMKGKKKKREDDNGTCTDFRAR